MKITIEDTPAGEPTTAPKTGTGTAGAIDAGAAPDAGTSATANGSSTPQSAGNAAGEPPAWLLEAISAAGGGGVGARPTNEQLVAAPTDAGAARLN